VANVYEVSGRHRGQARPLRGSTTRCGLPSEPGGSNESHEPSPQSDVCDVCVRRAPRGGSCFRELSSSEGVCVQAGGDPAEKSIHGRDVEILDAEKEAEVVEEGHFVILCQDLVLPPENLERGLLAALVRL
jgi:hypothetical protein